MSIDRQFLLLKLIFEQLCKLRPGYGLATNASCGPMLISLIGGVVEVAAENCNPGLLRHASTIHIYLRVLSPFGPRL